MTDRNKSAYHIPILLLLTLLFFTGSLTMRRDFWVEDEARYAEVVREMKQDGQWLVPHLNGYYYPDKPPLYFWLAALFTCLTGAVTPQAFLIINLLGAWGLVLTVYLFGRYMFDSLTGCLGAAVLLSSLLFMAAGHIVRMDMLFSFLIALSLYFFYRGYKERKRRLYLLPWLFSGLAVLTKGPFGFLFVFLPILVFLLSRSGGKALLKQMIQPGLLLFIAPVFGWLLLALAAGHADLAANIFSRQIAARAVAAFQHREPFYYYFLALPLVCMPWVALLPRAVAKKWRDWVKKEAYLLLLLWFALGFAVVSLVSGKLFIYLLPLLAPLALLLGNFFAEQWQQLKKGAKVGLALLFMGMGLISCAGPLLLYPRLDAHFSPRPLGEEIRYYAAAGYRPAGLRVTRGILSFYAQQEIRELNRQEAASFLDSMERRLLVIKARDLARLEKKSRLFREHLAILATHTLNNEQYFLAAGKESKKEGYQP